MKTKPTFCRPKARWQPLVAYLLLALMFLQLLNAATELSATIDEGFHITSGYEYLRTGQMQLMDEHVPLAKALFSWPLFFIPDLTPPEQAEGWSEGDLIGVAQETVLAYRPIQRVIVACRIPVVLLTLTLAATVYRWAADRFGPTAGLLALAMLSLDPNVLAHGSLATTDMGATAFILWAVWAMIRYLQRPDPSRWWTAALFLGLAQATKLTALLLLPILGLLVLIDGWRQAKPDRLRAMLRRALSYCGMLLVAGLVLWALYLFELRPLPGLAGELSLPAASHITRWLRLRANIAYGRESFLLGQNRMHGWWQYFPIAFALKTPLATLLLLLWALITFLTGQRRRWQEELALGLFPLIYAVLSPTSTINIGYRHLLPILPFLAIFTARLLAPRPSPLTSRPSPLFSRLALFTLLASLLIETITLSPHYLAYFNLLAGGPDQGYRFLADSNTDWGQGLSALADYQQQNDLGPVQLSLFTFLDPAAYGVQYEPIPPMRGAPTVLPHRFNPQPGLYAISATTLDGVPLVMPEMFDWFRHRTPTSKIGHVLFLYQVEAAEPAAWVAQCTVPTVPLPSETITEGFGSDSLRQVQFDCTKSWILPGGGTLAGWYVQATPSIDQLRWPTNSAHLEWWPDWVAHLPLDALHLNYVQPTPGTLPAFAIWEWSATSLMPSSAIEPVSLDQTLRFVGYTAPETVQPGTTVDLLTFWNVLTRPARPLSLMLHLVDAQGTPIAMGDGLGVSPDQWLPGDLIVQRHTLSIPQDAPAGTFSVYSGAYWLDDMTRLTSEAGDRIPLTTIAIIP